MQILRREGLSETPERWPSSCVLTSVLFRTSVSKLQWLVRSTQGGLLKGMAFEGVSFLVIDTSCKRIVTTKVKGLKKVATKKQKREAALKKREKYIQAEREIGLAALEKSRALRQIELREQWRKQHEKKHSWKRLVKECPLCQDKMNNGKQVKNA